MTALTTSHSPAAEAATRSRRRFPHWTYGAGALGAIGVFLHCVAPMLF